MCFRRCWREKDERESDERLRISLSHSRLSSTTPPVEMDSTTHLRIGTSNSSSSSSSSSTLNRINQVSVNPDPANDRPKKRRKPDKDSLNYALTSGLAGGIAGKHTLFALSHSIHSHSLLLTSFRLCSKDFSSSIR